MHNELTLSNTFTWFTWERIPIGRFAIEVYANTNATVLVTVLL